MSTIPDYLNWRGDLRFNTDPVNEVDVYILSKIGCPDYTGIVSADAESVLLSEAVHSFFARYGQEERLFGVLASRSLGPVLQRLTETERYKDLKLCAFVNKLKEKTTEQFSALSIMLPDGTVCVTFRGTDDTLLGWKENLMMSVLDTIPAQSDALEYLRRVASFFPGPLMVAGHSKGGNLAVYASSMVEQEIQERITAVFNYDGPGFRAHFFQNPGYSAVFPKIRTYLPQYSIVGMMLPRTERVQIVRSSRAGTAAHDGFQWEVLGPRFLRCEEFSRSTQAFEESLQTVLQNMDHESRIAFIDELFDTLASTGAETIADVTELHTRKALSLSREIYRKPEVHKFVINLIELMLRDFASSRRD
ncbi:MAG: DUF2974 domain-containing protein [Oscillospiraceae bacterium]|nr:DUF2974 domain-containing protein [Oscillospiraceae bacterium]